ncbi:MAG: hypothetical protein OFPI_27800 [Osedax symbiont Rs2]|nr:MAG: hypothetical protein OFPI_27800 [Osedax symbiont Rs2]
MFFAYPVALDLKYHRRLLELKTAKTYGYCLLFFLFKPGMMS